MRSRSKKIRVLNWQTKELIETWEYEATRKRYFDIVASVSPRKEAFTDEDLVDALSHYNSYCTFEIVESESEKEPA